MIKLDSKYKAALVAVGAVKQYPDFVNFLKIQRNNCMVKEFKFSSQSPTLIAMEKRYYQGQVDFINFLVKIVDDVKKGVE